MDQTAWALLAIRTRARRAEFARLFLRPAREAKINFFFGFPVRAARGGGRDPKPRGRRDDAAHHERVKRALGGRRAPREPDQRRGGGRSRQPQQRQRAYPFAYLLHSTAARAVMSASTRGARVPPRRRRARPPPSRPRPPGCTRGARRPPQTPARPPPPKTPPPIHPG